MPISLKKKSAAAKTLDTATDAVKEAVKDAVKSSLAETVSSKAKDYAARPSSYWLLGATLCVIGAGIQLTREA